MLISLKECVAKTGRRLKLLFFGLLMICSAIPTTMMIPLVFTAGLFKRYRHEQFLTRLHLMIPWARFCMRWIFGSQLDVQGQENIPKSTRGHLYICNHQSFADIPALASALGSVAFLAKQSIRRYPFIGRCAHAGGSVFVNRHSKQDRRRALDETMRMCSESTAVVVFPEGTLSRDGALLKKIYQACILRAHELGLKVIPIGLHGTCDVIPFQFDRINLGQPVAVRIGRPIAPTEVEDPSEFATRCWNSVRTLHSDAQQWVKSANSKVRYDLELVPEIAKQTTTIEPSFAAN